MPPLLKLSDESAYRKHFERTYCRGVHTTHDGIRVYFEKNAFDHAFFESSDRCNHKDVFSHIRAERMDWISSALTSAEAHSFQGWRQKTRQYDPTRRVTVVNEDFVVVIALSRRRNGTLKGSFVTCYRAEISIGKIMDSPPWTWKECQDALP